MRCENKLIGENFHGCLVEIFHGYGLPKHGYLVEIFHGYQHLFRVAKFHGYYNYHPIYGFFGA